MDDGRADKLIKSEAHRQYFRSLMNRGLIKQKTIDFAFFESIDIHPKQLFDDRLLTALCITKYPSYLALLISIQCFLFT